MRRAANDALGLPGVTADAFARELESAGIDLGPEDADRLGVVLDGSSEFVELEGGWVSVPAQFDGTRWITVIDDAGVKVGALTLSEFTE
jgi:hypothetical protein